MDFSFYLFFLYQSSLFLLLLPTMTGWTNETSQSPSGQQFFGQSSSGQQFFGQSSSGQQFFGQSSSGQQFFGQSSSGQQFLEQQCLSNQGFKSLLSSESKGKQGQQPSLPVCSSLLPPITPYIEYPVPTDCGSVSIGTRCSVGCVRGYELIGSCSRLCCGTGTWSGYDAICISK